MATSRYTIQERVTQLEFLLKEQEEKNELIKNALMKLTGSLAMELGVETCKSILNEANKI